MVINDIADRNKYLGAIVWQKPRQDMNLKSIAYFYEHSEMIPTSMKWGWEN